jgi:ABC-type multidrug transport system fused ATPase/permease subunit
MTTLLVAKAMSHIQVPDKHAFMMTLVRFIVGIVLYQAWNAYMRMSFITYTRKTYSTLLREYFAKFVQLDNNITERTGTGKMLSIMEKGVDVSVDLQVQTMYLGIGALIQVVFVTYLLTKVTWFAPLILYVFLVVVFLIALYLTRLGNEWRWKRDEVTDERTRHIVKILMSKFEILLNNKITEENQRFDALVSQTLYYDGKKLFYEHRSFNVPTIMLSVVTISLFVFLGYKFFYHGAITYAEIVLYLGLVNSLDSGTRDSIQLYKSYAKNFQRVEKLRQVFDETPVMP